MSTVALDNDVILKMAYYRLLLDLAGELDAHGGGAALGAAPFVIRSRIRKDGKCDDPAAVQDGVNSFFDSVEILEPTPEEESLAEELEELAAYHHRELDVGESQLCAIVSVRLLDRLLTGDKRAIEAIEDLVASEQRIAWVVGRVACLEQMVVSLAGTTGWQMLRDAVCSVPTADRALKLSFQCSTPNLSGDACREGLASYIGHLRRSASQVLAPGLEVWEP